MTSTKSTVQVSDMTKDTVTSKKETQQVEELEQDKYKDLMVKIDEMAKQLKGLANYVKDLRKENLQLVKELAKQEKKRQRKQRTEQRRDQVDLPDQRISLRNWPNSWESQQTRRLQEPM